MKLTNYKTHIELNQIPLELNWTKNCVMSDIAGNKTFKQQTQS